MIQATQSYAWLVFLLSWGHMGWVDWKQQKIRNHYVAFWLKFVLSGYLLIVGHTVLGEFGFVQGYILGDYYLALLGHAAFSITAAYALWWLRIWPAGDVKLFVLLSLCFPLMRIPGSFRSGLLFLEVLINVFIPAAAFLFLTAGEYLWRTRFAHFKASLGAYLGTVRFQKPRLPELSVPELRLPRALSAEVRLPDLDFRPGLGRVAASARAKAAAGWALVRKEIAEIVDAYRKNPRQLAVDAASWLTMMAVMSMISYYLQDIVKSNVLKTVICFALMFTWGRFCQFVGTGWALGIVFSAGAVALWRHPHFDLPALAVIFGHITVFSLFIYLGIQLAFKIIAGKTGYVFLPFLMMLPGLVPWRYLFGLAWGGAVSLLSWFRWPSLPRLDLPGLPAMPSLPPLPAPPPLPPLPALPSVDVLPAWTSALDFSGLMVWALMGLFFGLALVFVKIWDAESFKTVPIAHIDPYMTLGPSLVARIEADEDFRDEHFPTFYADGLTGEQAQALKEWCRAEGIDAVPLAPTISFANWIFLGYFLTRLLDGHVLRFLY